MDFKGGYDIAITGMGTIGLLTLQCAKALGARRIFVFDIDEERLKVAKEYGADVCLNTKNEEFKEIVAQATQGCGFKMVIETAGVEFTERLCLEMAANKGNVMFIGTPSKPISLKPREFEHINRKELTVRGSWMSYSAPFPGREWELAGYYFKKGQLKVEKLIHRIIPMEDIDKAFEEFMIPGKVKGKILMEV
jgi:L-iditol 2-dehydrogenase